MPPSLCYFHGCSLDSSPGCTRLCSTGKPKTEHSTLGMASPVLSRGGTSCLSTCWELFLMQPRILLTFFAGLQCWLLFNLARTRKLRCFYAKFPSIRAAPSIHWWLELFLSSKRTSKKKKKTNTSSHWTFHTLIVVSWKEYSTLSKYQAHKHQVVPENSVVLAAYKFLAQYSHDMDLHDSTNNALDESVEATAVQYQCTAHEQY